MFKEIGSNFWTKLEEIKSEENVHINLRFVSLGEQVVYSSSGRGAISLLISNMGSSGTRVLLPLYTCGSMVQPFVSNGYSIGFYGISQDLSVDIGDFRRQLGEFRPDIVLLHSFFGFDTLHQARVLYPELKNARITIIEDLTHSMFSDFEKSGADYYISSIRKWFCLPDGGAAISSRQNIKVLQARNHEKMIEVNLRAIRLKEEYSKTLDPKLKTEYRQLFNSTDHMLDLDCNYYSMSAQSRTIVSRTNFGALCSSRRLNYSYLLENLKVNSLVSPVFPILPEYVVPLYFLVYVKKDRDRLRDFLAKEEIYAPVHWPVPDMCIAHLSQSTEFIYNNILSIPCDQRYKEEDMERIIRRIAEYKG